MNINKNKEVVCLPGLCGGTPRCCSPLTPTEMPLGPAEPSCCQALLRWRRIAGCHEAGSTENRARTLTPHETESRTHPTSLSKSTAGDQEWVTFDLSALQLDVWLYVVFEISTTFVPAPQKGDSVIMATSDDEPRLCNGLS